MLEFGNWKNNARNQTTSVLGSHQLVQLEARVVPSTYSFTQNDVFGSATNQFSSSANAMTAAAPSTPQNLIAVDLSSDSVQLAWGNSSPASNAPTQYRIEMAGPNEVDFQPVAIVPSSQTQFSLGNLATDKSYSFRVIAVNDLGESPASATVAITPVQQISDLNFKNGFTNTDGVLIKNGSVTSHGSAIRLSDGQRSQVSSVFSKQTLDVSKFSTEFTFQQSGRADGFTFTVQAVSPNAVGKGGSALGYGDSPDGAGGIRNSMAIKFDIYGNNFEIANTTGMYLNGAYPGDSGATRLNRASIRLASGRIMRANIEYDGSKLNLKITDTVSGRFFTKTFDLNLQSVLGTNKAYVGFTAATGDLVSIQDVLAWNFKSTGIQPPAAPTSLNATPQSSSLIKMNWDGMPTNQTGYEIDRATDSTFTQNLVTRALPSTSKSFDDADSFTPGTTYYYRVRATNSAGGSAYSNITSASLPPIPAQPTDLKIDNIAASQINLSWKDNAGQIADVYQISRSVDGGNFEVIGNITGVKSGQSSSLTWSDTKQIAPGHVYEYRIVALNLSGASDSIAATATVVVEPTIELQSGFANSDTLLQLNGAAKVAGNSLRITDGGYGETSSVFSKAALNIKQFETEFTFTQSGYADGMTFAIQSISPNAIGSGGGGLGVGTDDYTTTRISKSAAIKFDLYNNDGEGTNSTGLFLNGVKPSNIGSVSLNNTGIILGNGELLKANISYDGSILTVTLTNMATNVSAVQTYTVDLQQVLGTDHAYVGFTGGTGGLTAVQNVTSWTYGPKAV